MITRLKFVTTYDKPRDNSKRITATADIVWLLATLFLLMYVAPGTFFFATINKSFCPQYLSVKIISASLLLLCVYFTVWFRLHTAFYSHSLMRELVSKTAAVINYATIAFHVLAGIASFILFYTDGVYAAETFGCVDVSMGRKTQWYVLTGCLALSEILLMLLWLIPWLCMGGKCLRAD